MGGNYNELGNFYTFKQSDAHTWVESYVENKGWVRFDPLHKLFLKSISLVLTMYLLIYTK